MSTLILPNIDGARVDVIVEVAEFSEAFELGHLSQLQPKSSWLDGLFSRRKSAWMDDNPSEMKRCLTGVGKILGKGPEGHCWRDGQRVMVAVEHREDVWLDRESLPMLGCVEPRFLETRESDKPSEFPVIIVLCLPLGVYEKLLASCEEVLSRPNGSVSLGMHLKFTNSYKSINGLGSGAALWYPTSVDFYRATSKL